jgi:regulator of cell morphogenesis and NO signaling
MEQLQLQNLTVGEIVANDFRTSSAFKKAGIDFCCGGKQSFSKLVSKKELMQYNLKMKF